MCANVERGRCVREQRGRSTVQCEVERESEKVVNVREECLKI